MGNLITQHNDESDPRRDFSVSVPPPPPMQPAAEPSMLDVLSEPQPTTAIPPVDPEIGASLEDPGNPLMDMPASMLPPMDFSGEDVLAPNYNPSNEGINTPDYNPSNEGINTPDYNPYTKNSFDGEIVTPDYTPFNSNVDQFRQKQKQREQQEFLQQLDSNSLQFLTSGQVYPTLYEGATDNDISRLNQRSLSLANESFQNSKRQQAQQTIVPLPQKRLDPSKPGFNSTQNPVGNLPGMIGSALQAVGDFTGITDQSGDFNPLAGIKPYTDAIAKNPWLLLTAPIAIPIVTSQAKFGEQGDGWWGGTMYALSIVDNLLVSPMTDLHNLVTGNKDPQSNLPAPAQAVLGGNYDFTQRATPHRPLGFIGGKEAPKTLSELQNRSGLYKMLLNPWSWEALRAIKKGVTGNENINIPDFKFQGLDGKVSTISGGRMLQGVEAVSGFIADVGKGAIAEFGIGAIDNAFRSGKKVAQVVTGEIDEATSAIVPVTKIQPVEGEILEGALVTPPPTEMKLLAPAIKTPTQKSAPAVTVQTRPNTVAPRQPGAPVITAPMLVPNKDVDDLVKELSTAPVGTQVLPEALITVERSNEELTEVAKLLGDVPPTRKKPLSRNRLDELAKSYPENLNPYKMHGAPIDTEAFKQQVRQVEIRPGEVAELADDTPITPPVDVPLPKDTQNIIPAIQQRKAILKDQSVDPQVRQQAAYELDQLYDNLVDTPDVSDPASLAETLRNIPRDMQTTSPEGVTKLQNVLTRQTIYEEAAEAEQALKPIYLNSSQYLADNLKEIDNLPVLGRASALKASPFTPTPQIELKFNPDAANVTNQKILYHGSQVKQLDLRSIEPLQGGSRNEYGPGIYLTTDRKFAEESAKAMPNRNLPPAPREFDEIGSVYEVTPNVRNPLNAIEPPPLDAHEAFLEAVRKSQPREIYRSVRKRLGAEPNKPLSSYYTTLDQVLASKLGKVTEIDSLQTQRLINDNLRVAGYDAIDDNDIVVLLGGSPGNSIGAVNNLGQVGTGDILEGYAARFNVAQKTAARRPDKVLEVQAREAGAQLQTELTRRVGLEYDAAASRAEDAAASLARAQDELEDFVKQERIAKQEQARRISDAQNRNQIANDSLPDKNPCI